MTKHGGASKSCFNIVGGDVCLTLVKRAFKSPLDSDWISDALHEYLVNHCLPCEFGIESVFKLDICYESTLIEVDIFDGSPGGEVLV